MAERPNRSCPARLPTCRHDRQGELDHGVRQMLPDAVSNVTGPSTEALAGLVERVTFHNADSGFCVLRVKARGQRDLVTVVGHAAAISAGEWVQMSGNWINDRSQAAFKSSFEPGNRPLSTPCRPYERVGALPGSRRSSSGRPDSSVPQSGLNSIDRRCP